MGIGHKNKQHSTWKQGSLWKQSASLSHGGALRQKRSGRGQRPLSTKHPLHLVFKIKKQQLKSRSLRTPKNFQLTTHLIWKYAKRFHIKVEQFSVQKDHIHLLIRTNKRNQFQNYFRVFSGQLAQELQKQKAVLSDWKSPAHEAVTDTPLRQRKKKRGQLKKLSIWLHRPFSRVVKGWKAYKTVRNYIQLNEQEALGVIPYQMNRLKGLSSTEWELSFHFQHGLVV
jgi:putative transposase